MSGWPGSFSRLEQVAKRNLVRSAGEDDAGVYCCPIKMRFGFAKQNLAPGKRFRLVVGPAVFAGRRRGRKL